MSKNEICKLDNRAIIKISGKETHLFLQGLISNDISILNVDNIIFSCMFNPQGKFFCDFFIFQPDINDPDTLFLDCELVQFKDIINKLNMYKLRAKVQIENLSNDFSIFSIGNTHESPKIPNTSRNLDLIDFFIKDDPRNIKLGKRIYVSNSSKKDFLNSYKEFINKNSYDKTRIELGIPDGIKDIRVEKDFPLDFGFNKLNAISFSKGCYIGQEITARTHNRGKIKKNLYIVKTNQRLPDFDSDIYYENKKVGRMLSKYENTGLAILNKTSAEDCIMHNNFLATEETKMKPYIPEWQK